MINIYDCRAFSAEEIINYMIGLNPSLKHVANRHRIYVGATRNIEERLYRHNAEDEVIF